MHYSGSNMQCIVHRPGGTPPYSDECTCWYRGLVSHFNDVEEPQPYCRSIAVPRSPMLGSSAAIILGRAVERVAKGFAAALTPCRWGSASRSWPASCRNLAKFAHGNGHPQAVRSHDRAIDSRHGSSWKGASGIVGSQSSGWERDSGTRN